MRRSILTMLLAVGLRAQSLTGVIDIHVHADPDDRPRSIDAIDIARLARDRGMRALVLKNHYEPTESIAYLARKAVPGIDLFGGIALNRTVGGVNPAAVERMTRVKGGWGRVVWMPTFDAENQVRDAKENRPFVSVSRNGTLLPEVREVLAIIAKNKLTLATGHSSSQENLMLIREARRLGVESIVVTHAMLPPVRMTVEQMQQAAGLGAYLEFVYNALIGPAPIFQVAEYAAAIRAVGPEHCIVSSDLGQAGNPLPPDGLAAFFAALRGQGFTESEIDRMAKTNPAQLLGLEPKNRDSHQVSPERPAAHFHHLHLNATDPAAAIKFYTGKFDCEKANFAGWMDGVWAQKSWLLFTRVRSAPPAEITSAIWHFGWGAEDMKDAYQKQLDMGTRFDTPIIELFPNFYFAYIDGPDHALIELNTADHHHFGHLHLLSADPIAAGEWYMKYFGATWRGKRPPSREPSFLRGFQVGPNMSLMMDNVNIIIFPMEYARQQFPEQWKGRAGFDSSEGRVVDHVAFSFENLAEALEGMRKAGVKVTREIERVAGGKIKCAFIEGPDKIRIELVEGHAQKE